MAAAAIRTAALLVLCLPTMAASPSPPSFPYTPTTILIPDNVTSGLPLQGGGDTAYIFAPSGTSVNLLALNISSTLHASSVRPLILTSGLPFLDSTSNTYTFTPSLLDNGSIAVYAGDCSSSNNFATWTYVPARQSTAETGLWTKHATSLDSGSGSSSDFDLIGPGPTFLGQGFSFSNTLAPAMSAPEIYVYGGMCPDSSTVSSSSWQSDATYSNQMLKLSPSQPFSNSQYTLELVSSNGPPLPEAGFTFTPLSPSLSNRSGVVTQQLNSVLLGGHTQQAFINISTAAIWSVPEESWSFVTITAPTADGSTELAKKGGARARRSVPTSVSPRSGHTAVLNEDGSSLVVLGGWVGDVSQAASPQLAVLEMGTDYDEWQWSIPTAQPPGPGMYGHGAALLPGNTMMIYGGYNISSSSAGNRKRQADADTSTAMFLNLTSMTWSTDYTNPTYANDSLGTASGGSPQDTQVGLGVGLGIGLSLPIATVIGGLWYLRRRKKKRRQSRAETVRSIAQDASYFLHPDDEMIERDESHGVPWGDSDGGSWYTGGDDPYMRGGRSLGYETMRGARSSGSHYAMSQPQRPLRKPVPTRVARGLYQPTYSNDHDAHRRGAGGIHPIYEADEDLEGLPVDSPGSITPGADNDASSDPFLTPTSTAPALTFPPVARGSGSRSPSPELPRRKGQHQEVQEWVSDADAADALLASRIQRHNTAGKRRNGAGHSLSPTGRAPAAPRSKAGSPTTATLSGDDEARTASNLSERSAFSFVRSDSIRSVLRLGTGAGAGAGVSAPGRHVGHSSSGSDGSGHTYNTAKSSFPTLQAEGPSLLLGRPSGGYADAPVAGDTEYDEKLPPSPSKTKPRRGKGWLGSLRNVFGGSTSESENHSPASSSRTGSPTRPGDEDGYEPGLQGLGGLNLGLGGASTLLRRKQGREAWEKNGEASLGGASGGGGAHGEDEWDIEKAVEQRLVQIMFTVPKERLRVVNADLEREEEAEIVNPEKDQSLERAEDGPQPGENRVERGLQGPYGLVEHKESDITTRPPTSMEMLEEVAQNQQGLSQSGLGTQSEAEEWRPEQRREPLQLYVDQAPDHYHHNRHRQYYEEAEDAGGSVSRRRFSFEAAGGDLYPLEPVLTDYESDITDVLSGSFRRGHTPVPGPLMTAEAVTLNRPGSPSKVQPRVQPRVLEIVESIERRSQSNSPEGRSVW